jgi:hypothetical protein
MTMKVYRISPDGQRRPVGATVTVPKGDTDRIPESLAYPACACPRCKASR